MNPVGLMQGRLTAPPPGRAQAFPWAAWREEWDLASACGFDGIEWLLTADRSDENPIWSEPLDRGVVFSVCADYFVERPLLHGEPADLAADLELLERLIERSGALGIPVVLLPVLELGGIQGDADMRELTALLREPLQVAAASGVRIALEADIEGAVLRRLIDRAQSSSLGAYYDCGNAVAAGHDLADDLAALAPVLSGVHIKDRIRGGASVRLGEGDVDFDRLREGLMRAQYRGPLILETPVGSDPLQSALEHARFVRANMAPRTVAS